MSNKGKRVAFHYTSTDTDGNRIETSRMLGEPIEFKCGEGAMFDEVEEALAEMAVGEVRTVTVPCAYGAYDETLVEVVPKDEFPNAHMLRVGKSIIVPAEDDGGFMNVKVVEITDTTVVLDQNHPLCGKDIVFEIELVGVADIPEDEEAAQALAAAEERFARAEQEAE